MTQYRMLNGESVAMTDEEVAALDASRVFPPVVPESISYRQAKTYMQLAPYGESNLWDAANALVDAITDPVERIKQQNFLRDSTVYERQRPELIALASSMGIAGSLDQMFIDADKL
jgi:hypothetical protein